MAGLATKRPTRVNHTNLAGLAYDRIEELIVTCALCPGLYLSIQDLQDMTGMGRTPIHQAVSRLDADTLIAIRPRHGLRIVPVDLPRERVLLQLRRDMEQFVVRHAAHRATVQHRAELAKAADLLRNGQDDMTIVDFNRLDRSMDRLLVAAAGEPLLENTLRPLHTVFRRIGWIYHYWIRPDEGLAQTITGHAAILDAVAAGQAEEAVAAVSRLITFSDSMFDVLAHGMDPALFNGTLKPAAST